MATPKIIFLRVVHERPRLIATFLRGVKLNVLVRQSKTVNRILLIVKMYFYLALLRYVICRNL